MFSDVLAVLFEELFCLKEKRCLHMVCTLADQEEAVLRWIYLKVFWKLCSRLTPELCVM